MLFLKQIYIVLHTKDCGLGRILYIYLYLHTFQVKNFIHDYVMAQPAGFISTYNYVLSR